jgi:ABC-2 type transport system permease protein
MAALAVEGLLAAAVLAAILTAWFGLDYTDVFNMAIMVFGGMLVPVTVFPGPIEIVSRLVPTALGVQAFNTTLADGLGQSWTDGTLPWLLVHTAVLLVAGLATYGAALRRALREGALSPR